MVRVGYVCLLPSPPELAADVLPDMAVLTKSQAGFDQGHLGQRLGWPHALQELEDSEVVFQEVSALVLFDGRPDTVDHFEQSTIMFAISRCM